MDAIKKGQPILTVANTAGLIGITVYFYRAITALQSQQVKLSGALQNTINMVGKMQQEDRSKAMIDSLHVLDGDMEDIKCSLEEMANLDDLEALRCELDDLIKSVKANGIDVEHSHSYSPPRHAPPPRQQSRRAKPSRTTAKSRIPNYRNRDSNHDDQDDERTVEPVTRNPIGIVRANRRGD